jgi:hypothetical protein
MKAAARFVLSAMVALSGTVPGFSAWGSVEAQAKNEAEATAGQGSPAEYAGNIIDSPGGLTLKSGTEVKLAFAQSLSSKHATMGEKVELRVTDDVKVDQIIAIPAGARALGIVVQGKKNEKYGNSKNIAVRVDYVVVKGRKIKLAGEKFQKPKTDAGAATAAAIGFGVSGLMIYMNNREAWIREGAPATGYVAEDVVFAESDL